MANKQLEIMGRYMAELGLTPSARARVALARPDATEEPITFKVVYQWKDGTERDEDGNLVDDPPGKVIDMLPGYDQA